MVHFNCFFICSLFRESEVCILLLPKCHCNNWGIQHEGASMLRGWLYTVFIPTCLQTQSAHYSVCKNTQFGIYVIHVMVTDGRHSSRWDRWGLEARSWIGHVSCSLTQWCCSLLYLIPTPEKKMYLPFRVLNNHMMCLCKKGVSSRDIHSFMILYIHGRQCNHVANANSAETVWLKGSESPLPLLQEKVECQKVVNQMKRPSEWKKIVA